MGRIVAALRRMGFNEIFDTSTGADLTVLEESAEFLEYLNSGDRMMPLFTSCCPAWINYCQKNAPEMLALLKRVKPDARVGASAH